MYFKNEADWQKKLIRELAKEYGIDIRVVRQIVYYPFLFTKHAIQNKDDITAIRHRHLGVFNMVARFKRHFDETKVKGKP